jgi:hypothetical protein
MLSSVSRDLIGSVEIAALRKISRSVRSSATSRRNLWVPKNSSGVATWGFALA